MKKVFILLSVVCIFISGPANAGVISQVFSFLNFSKVNAEDLPKTIPTAEPIKKNVKSKEITKRELRKTRKPQPTTVKKEKNDTRAKTNLQSKDNVIESISSRLNDTLAMVTTQQKIIVNQETEIKKSSGEIESLNQVLEKCEADVITLKTEKNVLITSNQLIKKHITQQAKELNDNMQQIESMQQALAEKIKIQKKAIEELKDMGESIE